MFRYSMGLFVLALSAFLATSSANAQTLGIENNIREFSLGNPFIGHSASYHLRGIALIPKQLPVIRIEQFRYATGAGRFRPAKQSYAARTRSYSSCGSPCKPVLPFHEPPIRADDIVKRCNKAGLAGLAVGALRLLSERANSPR